MEDQLVKKLRELDGVLNQMEEKVFHEIGNAKARGVRSWDKEIALLNENWLKMRAAKTEAEKQAAGIRRQQYRLLENAYESALQQRILAGTPEQKKQAEEEVYKAFRAKEEQLAKLSREVEAYFDNSQRKIELRREDRNKLASFFAEFMFRTGKSAYSAIEFSHPYPFETPAGGIYEPKRVHITHLMGQFKFYERLRGAVTEQADKKKIPAVFSGKFGEIYRFRTVMRDRLWTRCADSISFAL